MLRYIELMNVGPAGEKPLRLDFGPRLNILTGDNGLGKTFALDIAWWALTRTWPHHPAWPRKQRNGAPAITYEVEGEQVFAHKVPSTYDFNRQCWSLPPGGKPMPGLVLYARVDGGFSVWDPARNYWRERDNETTDASKMRSAYHFTNDDVWNGLSAETDDEVGTGGGSLCNGLIRDWVTWQYKSREAPFEFAALQKVLQKLSPSESEILRAGKPVRVSIEDTRDIPTIEMPYGTVPVTLASAGIKRIIALAYLMVWAWSENQRAAELRNQPPMDRFVLLFDEVETHLHPQWQRVFLPALLDVVKSLGAEAAIQRDNIYPRIQIIASTHAPLVMASVEPHFSEELDRMFNFDLSEKDVQVRQLPWAKQGDAVNWLVSDAFGLRQARSREAEEAIEAAEAFMRNDLDALPEKLKDFNAIHDRLLKVLPGNDTFWPRWIVHHEKERE